MTTPQPSRQARSSGRSLSILMQLASCTTVWWANVPSAPMASVRSLPSLSWWRDVPSLSCMPVAVMLPRSHRLLWPLAQLGHLPHAGTKPNTTWSPGATLNTPGPTSSTMPAPSWPPMVGSGAVAPARSPVTRCSSLWHMPLAIIFTRTSPALGGSSSISSTLHGVCNSRRMAALVFTMFPFGPSGGDVRRATYRGRRSPIAPASAPSSTSRPAAASSIAWPVDL